MYSRGKPFNGVLQYVLNNLKELGTRQLFAPRQRAMFQTFRHAILLSSLPSPPSPCLRKMNSLPYRYRTDLMALTRHWTCAKFLLAKSLRRIQIQIILIRICAAVGVFPFPFSLHAGDISSAILSVSS